MNYQWDPHKAQINLRKHGISFADAVLVFEDTAAVTIEDEHDEEERYITIGMAAILIMKTRHPQIAQISPILKPNLCHLRNLWID